MTPVRRTPVLVIILVSYLMIVLDISITITAIPKIDRALDFSAASLSWVQTAYTLTFGGLLLLGARAGDIFGRRRMFVYGVALFTLASLLVGAAQSPGWLVAARALQGVGAAVLAPRRWRCCRRASRTAPSAHARSLTTAPSRVSARASVSCWAAW